jgi:hypothetical protein
MTFKKNKDGAFVVTWKSDDEDDDEQEMSNKAFAPIALSKKASLFDTSHSCFMAKGATKVQYDESDDDSEVEYVNESENENESDNDDEPTKSDLYDMLQQTKDIAIAKNKECKGLQKKVKIIEKAHSELKATHECLKKDHEDLGKAHSMLEKALFIS